MSSRPAFSLCRADNKIAGWFHALFRRAAHVVAVMNHKSDDAAKICLKLSASKFPRKYRTGTIKQTNKLITARNAAAVLII